MHGDINAGGIAGTMNVEYDVDPEYDLDITETTNVRLRSTVSDVVIYCINYGEVNSKKTVPEELSDYRNLDLYMVARVMEQ